MIRMLAITFFLASLCSQVLAQTLDHNVLPCPVPGGYAQTEDLVGLIVSSPETTQLLYFNTSTEKELKRIDVDFKPGALCRQGKTLYVAGQGSGVVYSVDLSTGKTLQEIEVGGDAIVTLACHSDAGMVYAATASRAIFSINPATGKATKTTAVGKYLGVTADKSSLITGFQPGDGEYDYKVAEGKRIVIPWSETWGTRAQINKYKISGSNLTFVAAQNNAASNGWSFHLSPDGKRVAMPGGGGWRPVEGTGGGYITALFSTENLETMLAQIPSGIGLATHPVLDLGATSHDDGVRFYRGKAWKPAGEFKMKGNGASLLLATAAKGTKFIFWNGIEAGQGLHFLPLELTEEDESRLKKVYGDLPRPVEIAMIESPAKADLPTASAKPSPEAPPSTKSTPQLPPGARPAAKPPTNTLSKTSEKGKAKSLPTKLDAFATGFNDAEGINADKKRYSPYPVGASGVTGGQNEPGWNGTWELKGDAKFTSFVGDAVQEGDGALYFAGGTGGVVRKFAFPFSTPLEVEQYVRIPEGGHLMCYVGKEEHATAAMWMISEGKFLAIDGTGEQFGGNKAVDTGIQSDPDKWHKVVVKLFPKDHEYEVYIDDEKCGERYHFRANVDTVGELRYACEKAPGFLLDAIQVRSLSKP